MLTVKHFQFNPIQENTYLVYNEFNDCAIIDPGCYSEDEKDTLANFIETHHLKPVVLLNTHCHLDHVFGNAFAAEKYSLPLHMHATEKAVLDFAPTSGLMYDLPFVNYTGDCVYINDGETISVGKDSLKLLLTPGHSPGSLSFYSEADGFVISGDALFYRSVGRSDLPGGDEKVLLKSIREKLFTLPAATKVYSGHGPVTTIGDEVQFNPFLQ